jgi:hypothetical protein
MWENSCDDGSNMKANLHSGHGDVTKFCYNPHIHIHCRLRKNKKHIWDCARKSESKAKHEKWRSCSSSYE